MEKYFNISLKTWRKIKELNKLDSVHKIIENKDFRNLILNGLDFDYAKLNYAKFNNSKLNNAKLNNAELNDAKLNNAKLNGAKFTNFLSSRLAGLKYYAIAGGTRNDIAYIFPEWDIASTGCFCGTIAQLKDKYETSQKPEHKECIEQLDFFMKIFQQRRKLNGGELTWGKQ